MKSIPRWAFALALLVSPHALVAQAITGVVRDQATGDPMSAAQVFIPELDVGVLSQADGGYLIQNVPAGTHSVRAERIGYRTVVHEVTVGDGQTVVQDFIMSSQALQLDEVVVTGTATGARVREIGNSVAQLDATIAETQPIANVSDLLRGRVAGVSIAQGSGAVGGASAIKIRGSSTMRLVNDGPLLYVDGVRVSNEMEGGGTDVSRIDDFDPAMIESIQVIKGPAAATLYGTEAANGVIQIITKRGVDGEARWNFTARQGANWFRDPAGHSPTNWGVNPNNGEIESLNILEDPEERNKMFRNGRSQYYGVDVSGGSAAFQYFVSGSASSDEGATYNSWAKKYSGRVNVTAQPMNELVLSANAGVALTRLRLPSDFPYDDAVYASPVYLDERRGYRAVPPEARYERDHDFLDANRVTAGLTVTHTPFEWLTQRLTFGVDITDQEDTQLDQILSPQSAQFYSARAASGGKSVGSESQFYTTFDYSVNATRDLSQSFASTTSAGFQVYARSRESVNASGTGFPAIGLSAISATGERTGSDNLVENNTVGVYLQQQIGWRDRLFITGAVRADDNSAFGEEFDLVYYPKVSLSWVVNEESFWGLDFVNSFRLRAAYGESGQQPDAFDALRSFSTRASFDGSATLRPESPGNASLGPERGVEIEAGFDAAFFDNRVTLDFTYYDQKTKDAIVGRDVAPSAGFAGETEFVNLGEVSNRGIELGLGARIIEASSFDWDMNLNLSTNRNRIEELGLDGFLQLGWTTRHTEGYPVGSLWAPDVIEATLDPDGVVRNYACDDGNGQPVVCDENSWIYQGHPDPNVEGSLSTSFTIGDRLTIEALATGKIGQTKYDLQAWWRYAAYQQTELNLFPENFDPRDVAEAQYGNSGEFGLWVNDASFIRFRELSLSYRAPDSWVQRIGASQATFSVAARNLGMIWTKWPEWPNHDPEVVDPSNTFSGNREPQEDATVPPLTSLSFTLRLTM